MEFCDYSSTLKLFLDAQLAAVETTIIVELTCNFGVILKHFVSGALTRLGSSNGRCTKPNFG
jgi:hypothetical protein